MGTIVGLDLSLTATGICVDGNATVIKSKKRGMERLEQLRDAILFGYRSTQADLVVIEGYAMGTGSQAGSYAIGELGGLIRFSLWEYHVPYVEIPPKSLKLFGSGKGNANKVMMGMAAQRAGYEGPADDNAIDSWWLYHMAVYALCADPTGHLPATEYRNRALLPIDWPILQAAPA